MPPTSPEPKKEKHNLLILPKGYGEFQEKCKQWEPKKVHEDPTVLEKGFAPTKEMDKRNDVQGARLRWRVPANLCMDCGRKDVQNSEYQNLKDGKGQGSQGFYFGEALVANFGEEGAAKYAPELMMSRFDVAEYYVCRQCRFDALTQRSDKAVLVLPRMTEHLASMKRPDRIASNIRAWIKAQIQAGEKPLNDKQT